MAGSELPIFELPLVLLPGERLPLHIFEERYKQMVGRSLEHGLPFGILLRDDDGARATGCTAIVDEVIEQSDDGSSDILVIGETPFQVLDRYEAADWPAAEVELVSSEDELPPADQESATSARKSFAELAELATGDWPDPDELAETTAYEIAARVELPDATKQRLLESRDEDERMQLLANALGALRSAVDRAELIADRARSNGRVRFGSASAG